MVDSGPVMLNDDELTIALIKPDVSDDYAQSIIREMLGMPMCTMTSLHLIRWRETFAMEFYKDLKDKPFFNDLVTFMCSGNIYVAVLVGPSIIQRWRTRIGATDPKLAELGTIRRTYGSKTGPIMRNAVHGSANAMDAYRELHLFASRLSPLHTHIPRLY